MRRQGGECRAELRNVLELDENFPACLDTLGAICAQQGRFEEALRDRRAYALTPWANVLAGQLAALLVRTGAKSRADALIEKLRPGKAYGAPTGMAVFTHYPANWIRLRTGRSRRSPSGTRNS